MTADRINAINAMINETLDIPNAISFVSLAHLEGPTPGRDQSPLSLAVEAAQLEAAREKLCRFVEELVARSCGE